MDKVSFELTFYEGCTNNVALLELNGKEYTMLPPQILEDTEIFADTLNIFFKTNPEVLFDVIEFICTKYYCDYELFDCELCGTNYSHTIKVNQNKLEEREYE